MRKCKLCGKHLAANILEVCYNCIKKDFEKALPYINKAHKVARSPFNLPSSIPSEGLPCNFCGNSCRISTIGFCGLTERRDNKIKRIVSKDAGLGVIYEDPHPTNCVASYWCAGGSDAGYPKYSVLPSPEIGYLNAAIFIASCSYSCLFCQNYEWLDIVSEKRIQYLIFRGEIVEKIKKNRRITCVCWFGGDPCTKPEFVYRVSKDLRECAENENRILRICLETNGNFRWEWLKNIAELSLNSGGGIKFDLKFPRDSMLNLAICGVSNENSYKNFEKLGRLYDKRLEVPFLRASTLLIPHYITVNDIKEIAEFIASIDTTIPYCLLAYYPTYHMRDIGFTSKEFALQCYKAARKVGLENVRIGNVHLLK